MSTVLANGMAVIVLNQHKDIPLVRLRFSALHELAHLYLELSSFDDKQAEKLCDSFASAMLLPAGKGGGNGNGASLSLSYLFFLNWPLKYRYISHG